jgi:hypothetical protein
MLNRRTVLVLIASALPAAACSARAKAATITVYKSPYCGCCTGWVEHLRATGFEPVVQDVDDLGPLAAKLGIPKQARSCHTGVIAGYFVEGHVPSTDIRKLLNQRPSARGIAVPGMPIGSPGMEQEERRDPYDTLLIGTDGQSRIFTSHNRS